ncbi:MAG: amidohydrolase [Planctomycetota bacterium]|jgi:predicted amidohydrolase YtcJ
MEAIHPDEILHFMGGEVWLHRVDPNAAPREVLVNKGVVSAIEPKGRLAATPPSNARIIDLEGGLLIPAFFDGHLHLEIGGKSLRSLQIADALEPGEVLKRVADRARTGSGWLIGWGLHEAAWPCLDDFNRACEKRPVFLYTRDYHSALLSRVGMAELGIDASYAVPAGGVMELDEGGEPSGIFRENAVSRIEGMLPEAPDAERLKDIETGIEHLVRHGVLGISHGPMPDDWHLLRKLEEEDRLPIRIESWAPCHDLDATCLDLARGESPVLRRSRIKLFLDGALGSRTAWMRSPYTDKPDHHPGPVPDLERFEEILEEGVARGWSFTVHAIGDAAMEHAMKALENLPAPGGPHRVEHVQHVDASMLAHEAWNRLVPSIQPVHRTEDLGMLVARVGPERAGWSFPARSLWRDHRPLALGTDWPVVSADPLATIRSAVSSRKAGEGMAAEALSLAQALECATRGSAQAAGFENVGAIAVGAPADFVWLYPHPNDSMEGWHDTRVRAVWRGGKRIHGG